MLSAFLTTLTNSTTTPAGLAPGHHQGAGVRALGRRGAPGAGAGGQRGQGRTHRAARRGDLRGRRARLRRRRPPGRTGLHPRRRPRRDGCPGRRVRGGQVGGAQPRHRVHPPRLRPAAGRRRRHEHLRPAHLPALPVRGAPGVDPVRRHRAGERRLRHGRRGRGDGPRRAARRQRAGVRRPAAPGPGHPRRERGARLSGGPVPAAGHRPRPDTGPQGAGAGRGDLGAGHPLGDAGAGGARPAAARADHVRRGAPAVHGARGPTGSW